MIVIFLEINSSPKPSVKVKMAVSFSSRVLCVYCVNQAEEGRLAPARKVLI